MAAFATINHGVVPSDSTDPNFQSLSTEQKHPTKMNGGVLLCCVSYVFSVRAQNPTQQSVVFVFASLFQIMSVCYCDSSVTNSTRARRPFRKRKLGKKGARNAIFNVNMITKPIAKTNRNTVALVARGSGATSMMARCRD